MRPNKGQKLGGKGGYHVYSRGGHRMLGTRDWIKCAPQAVTGFAPRTSLILQAVGLSLYLLPTLQAPCSMTELDSPGAPRLHGALSALSFHPSLHQEELCGQFPGDWRMPDQ